MSVTKKVAATAAALVLAMGVFTPVAGAQEAPVETVSPAPEVADTTTLGDGDAGPSGLHLAVQGSGAQCGSQA